MSVKIKTKVKKTKPAATLPWDVAPPNKKYDRAVKALKEGKNA